MISKIEKTGKAGRVFWQTAAILMAVSGLAAAGSPPVSIEQLYRHRALYSEGNSFRFSDGFRQEVSPVSNAREQKPKSVAMAAGLSLLIPGAGQLYVGDRVRALPFFLADVGGWVTYFGFRSQGKKREREYRSFADAHYDPQNYLIFLDTALGITSRSDFDPVGAAYDSRQFYSESVVNLVITDSMVIKGFVFAHHIPSKEGGPVEKNFEYYENLGKYDQFFAGWDDFNDAVSGNEGLNRRTYLVMRSQANSSFSKSKIGLAVSLVDRMAAAVDAALAAKRFNKKLGQTREIEIGFKLTRYNGARLPKLLATYKF